MHATLQALKRSIYAKSTSSDQKLVLERAFKQMDRDGSGSVNMAEFIDALKKFGMQVCLVPMLLACLLAGPWSVA